MERRISSRWIVTLLCVSWIAHALAAAPQERAFDMPSMKKFIRHWRESGAGEMRNSQAFIVGLCEELGLPQPDGYRAGAGNGYIFEKPVPVIKDGKPTTLRIDLYRQGCFIWESKQYYPPGAGKKAAGRVAARGGRSYTPVERRTKTWDDAIIKARLQAETYARSLAPEEGHVPFLIVADIGHSFDILADFQGRGIYTPFPSAKDNRIFIEDLIKHEVQELLRAIWLDPMSLDPTRITQRVTETIADDLSKVAASLEASGHNPDTAAMFLMRCIFCLFAEDVALLPTGSFSRLLERYQQQPDDLALQISLLWQTMKNGGRLEALDIDIPQIGGYLFEHSTALPLTEEQIELLSTAAGANWANVQPSIFGVLLQRALSATDRKRLGADYTPQVYVERLVIPTIIEPLRHKWRYVANMAMDAVERDDYDSAVSIIEDFHRELCNVTVLDPAAGCGNILVTAFNMVKDLEDEVNAALYDLGKKTYYYDRYAPTVSPDNFRGIEVNLHAAAISELVLTIAQLQRHYQTFGMVRPREPVLTAARAIQHTDAVLEYSGIIHGEYQNPTPAAEWPSARFIVGNPPFSGANQKMREALGDGYVDALHNAYSDKPDGINLVMYWWGRAAEMVKSGKTERAGLITTTTIRQKQNRRIVQEYLEGEQPVSIVYAIPNHPWIDADDAASVRIAMTVIERGNKTGTLARVVEEAKDIGFYSVELKEGNGFINANLTLGADTTEAKVLQANAGLATRGVQLRGKGFSINQSKATEFGYGTNDRIDKVIRPYVNGRDVVGKPRDQLVIDCYGMNEDELESEYPLIHDHLSNTVKMQRGNYPESTLVSNWWLFGANRPSLRNALAEIDRYIVTPETSKHRIFTFVDGRFLPDHSLIVIPTEDAYYLGILSSRIHTVWAKSNGGALGNSLANNRYFTGDCFNTFPFPEATTEQRNAIRALAEKIEGERRSLQEGTPRRTLTQIYNALEAVDDTYVNLVELAELHRQLDTAVMDAYGWPHDLTDGQVANRLILLNADRSRDEAAGKIRWPEPNKQPTVLLFEGDEDPEEEKSAEPYRRYGGW